MIRHYMRPSEHGDPVLTIKVTGIHDIYRLAYNLTYDQVEFCEQGHSILRKLKRRLGKQRYLVLLDYMHGTGNGEVTR